MCPDCIAAYCLREGVVSVKLCCIGLFSFHRDRTCRKLLRLHRQHPVLVLQGMVKASEARALQVNRRGRSFGSSPSRSRSFRSFPARYTIWRTAWASEERRGTSGASSKAVEQELFTFMHRDRGCRTCHRFSDINVFVVFVLKYCSRQRKRGRSERSCFFFCESLFAFALV